MPLSEMINIFDSESAVSQSLIHLYYELVTDQWPVSQKSRKFSGLFRVPQFSFVSSQRRGSKPSNLAILLVFLTLKTC